MISTKVILLCKDVKVNLFGEHPMSLCHRQIRTKVSSILQKSCLGDVFLLRIQAAHMSAMGWWIRISTYRAYMLSILEPQLSSVTSSRMTTAYYKTIKHRATLAKSLAGIWKQRITVLPWPENSPDPASIETMWAIIKNRFKDQDVSSKQKLIAAVIKLWY